MSKAKEANNLQDRMRKTLEARRGLQVRVEGMWTGDFIGTVIDPGVKGCQFRVDEPFGKSTDAAKAGDVVFLPYGEYMRILDCTPTPEAA